MRGEGDGTEDTLAAAGEPTRSPTVGAKRDLGRGVLVGRYVVLSKLGAGGMGIVYAAYDPELDRKVALKLLRPGIGEHVSSARARLLREAQALGKLSHPNVVAIHDLGTRDEDVWLAMEFVAGRTLSTWLNEGRRSWRDVLGVLQPVALGLAAAHEVGLVHRDIKPDNVMIGDDDRVRVMDFGLARGHAPEPLQQSLGCRGERHGGPSQQVRVGDRVTRLGATPGTPAYMAPEQFTGQDTDARSDQFSFCVMLWEALFGERPFAGASMLDLAAAVLEGNLRAPPRGANVPYWLRRVVERGLATDPDDRFASMPALLKGLRGGRTIARARRTAAAVVAMAIAGVGGLAMTRYDRGQRIAACEAAGATIDEVWNDDQRGAVRAALLASGAGHAATTADKLIPWLDAQASAWRRARSDACLDVYVHRVWDADTLERSVWCLDDRRFELDALVTELKAADVEAVTRAVPAAAGLQQVDPCRDRALVERSPAPPTEGRDAVQAVRAGLSRARALQATGAYAQGLQVANESLLRAQALGWPPLVATAELDVGVLQDANGAYADAESMLESAYFDAATAGATEDALSAAQQLVYTTGSRLARHGDGERWSRHAEVLRAALPDPARLREATSLNNLANVRHASGAYEEAATLHEGALAIREQALGPAHPDVASSLNNVAVVRYTMGAYDEAATLHERVFAIRQKVLGLDHPDVAVTLNNLAAVRYATGAFEEAAALYERALAIRERALGREHPDVATSLNSLAVVRNATGAYEEARTLLERALPIRQKASGAEHPLVATLLNNLAIGRHGVGAYNEAAILHERALAIREKTLGPDHPDVANSLANLAAVHNAAEAYEQAMALYERALAIREKTLGPDHPSVAQPLIGLAKVALAQGRHSEAVVLAERAAKLRGADDVPVTELAQARMVLARALAESRRDPGRAVLLAEQARDAYRDAGDAYRDEAAEAEALLRDHEGGP